MRKKLNESYDEQTVENIITGLKSHKKTTLRINRLKTDFLSIKSELDNMGIKYSTLKTFEDAFIIDVGAKLCEPTVETAINYPNIESEYNKIIVSDKYKEGKIYLQSLSSMLPVYILDTHEKENILDMCAAPGSKTTLIQSFANNKANVTAVELHKDRFERLKYNIDLQAANVYCINMNALDLNDNFKFDKILLDVPCSGSGTLDISNNDYEKYFTDKLIEKCVKTQKNLLKKAYKLLNNGGVVVYSTCSLLKEENEDLLDYATKIGFKVEKCDLKDFINTFDKNDFSIGCILENENFIKIMPNEVYEGFFVGRLSK